MLVLGTFNKRRKIQVMTDEPVSNVMNELDTKVRIERTLDKIFKTVASTSGPFGSNVIIQDDMIGHYTTKDGYTAMKNIVFKEEFDRTICEFIKKVSARLNSTVGDGTTSAVILACKLYKKLLKFAEDYSLPYREVLELLSEISIRFEVIIRDLVTKKIEIKEDDSKWLLQLYRIAYTSANNNAEIGKIVTKAFEMSPYGVIDIKNGSGEETTLQNSPGFEHNRGYINQFLAFKDKKFEASGKVKILMSSLDITDLDIPYIGELLQHICLEDDAALVILAPSFSEGVVNMIYQNKMNPQLKDNLRVCLVDIATKSSTAKEKFDDLAIFINAKPFEGQFSNLKKYDEDFALKGQTNMPFLGEATSVTISEKNSYFSVREINQNALNRREEIAKKMKELMTEEENGSIYDKSEEIAILRKRYTNLSPNGAIIIKIGGVTDQERKNLYYLLEDAVHACRSALKFGIVPGLNYANFKTLFALKKYNKEAEECGGHFNPLINSLADIIIETYEEATKFILFNGNPTMTESKAIDIIKSIEYNDTVYDIRQDIIYAVNGDNEYTIYNSVETDVEVLKTSFSIIGLLLNSSNFICSKGYIVV